jgi:hypothetical protein
MYINHIFKRYPHWSKYIKKKPRDMFEKLRNISAFQIFHLGEIAGSFQNIMSMLSEKDQILFSGDTYRLPYNVCYFDFWAYHPKAVTPTTMRHACFCIQIKPDLLAFIPFHTEQTLKDWVIDGFYIEVKPECESKERMLTYPIYEDEVWEHISKGLKVSEDELHKDLTIVSHYTLTVVHTGLVILNCRNITTAYASKLQKKKKSKKKNFLDYKILVVESIGKSTKGQKRDLWKNRVHLMRGHFKTYTADAPLFGKYTGRYWWQPSVRGSKKEGIIFKDYEVET